MALVPNGRMRVQEKQSLLRNSLFSFAQQTTQTPTQQKDVAQQPKPEPRLAIEQQEIAEQPQATPTTAPAQTPAENEVNETMLGGEAKEPVLNNGKGGKPETNEAGGESDIKDAWKQMLETLGVPPRTMDSLEKQLYSEENNLADSTMKGHYMIPTYTAKGKITKEKALQLARQMEQKFGLTSRMKLEGRNWRIDFSTRPQVDLQEGGSSFDLMNNARQQQKAASYTMGEMLTARKEELFNTMRKIGKGN